jgi:Ca2+/H+ antiporter, TMEM165/GDT1 family
MNLVVAATVFPVIFLGELPDKTMFASLVLASRGRPLATWLGAAAAFAVHVVVATTIGVLAFRLLPPRILETATAVIFLAGAVIAARGAGRTREPPGGPVPAPPDPPPGTSARTAGGPVPAPPDRPPGTSARTAAGSPVWRPVIASFAVIFAAEWGDLTQILTANLSAQYHAPLSVGTGALLALWAAAAIAVTGGRHLSRLVSDRHLQIVTAVLLTGLAVYAGWSALR